MKVVQQPEDYRVLLISDGSETRTVADNLSVEFKLDVTDCDSLRDEARIEWAASFDVVVLHAASIPSQDRLEIVETTLRRLVACEPSVKAITLVRGSDRRTRDAALAAGAWEVTTLSEAATQLTHSLRAAAARKRLDLEANGKSLSGPMARQMIGASAAALKSFAMIRQVAQTDLPVLITGESGTGKELAAIAIHERSRRTGDFVPINCAAIPHELLESELFGHEKGAFTGATRSILGTVELANRGTLLLDEVGELDGALQSKLLRFLEDHVVVHLGGRRRRHVDVRVLAATNGNLAQMVEAGKFREDLYYRLAVFVIDLPPLRERVEDVLLMARFYLDRYAHESGKSIRGFSREALYALCQARWPGNVRELINRIRRAVVVADGPLVTPQDLGFDRDRALLEAPLRTLREARARSEIESIRAALAHTSGNRTEAARALGISRQNLYDLLGRHEIE